MTTAALENVSKVVPQNTTSSLAFCETAKKMRGLGIALILFGVALLAGAAVGIMIFHARQGLVPLPYHYLILSLIGATGAALAILSIYQGIKLQFKAYDNDPSYKQERLKEFQAEFRRIPNDLYKLCNTLKKFDGYFNRYVTITDINALLKEVIFKKDDDASTLRTDIENLGYVCLREKVENSTNFYLKGTSEESRQ